MEKEAERRGGGQETIGFMLLLLLLLVFVSCLDNPPNSSRCSAPIGISLTGLPKPAAGQAAGVLLLTVTVENDTVLFRQYRFSGEISDTIEVPVTFEAQFFASLRNSAGTEIYHGATSRGISQEDYNTIEINMRLTVEAPQITRAGTQSAITLGQTYKDSVRVTAPGGVATTIMFGALPRNMAVSGNAVTWIPADTGQFTMSAVATDEFGQTDSVGWELTVVDSTSPLANRTPVFVTTEGDLPDTLVVGEAFNYTLMASDPDGDSLTWSIEILISNLTYSGGFIGYSPGSADTGRKTINFIVQDPSGASASLVWSFSVRPALSLPGNILYVNTAAPGINNGSSWDNAFKDLQKAIESADSGTIIWVASGTYIPSTDGSGNPNPADSRLKTFQLKAGVMLFGGFGGSENSLNERDIEINTSILSGDIGTVQEASDNVYHVVTCTATTVVDGFTITGGYADSTSPYGGGMNLYGNGSPIIKNLIFHDNYAVQDGGAICTNNNPVLTLENCEFVGNSCGHQGGAIHTLDGVLNLKKCSFKSNTALNFGGAIHSMQTGLNSEDCIYYDNHGSDGAAYYGYQITGTFTNNIFYRNSVINSAGGSGCLRTSTGSELYLWNCTFLDNQGGTDAYSAGSIVTYSPDAPPLCETYIYNSIFWTSDITNPREISNWWGRTHIRNSILMGGLANIKNRTTNSTIDLGGNQEGDPLFLSTSNVFGADGRLGTSDDGLALQESSPGINSGFSTGAPQTDITGLARPQGNGMDIGAYELQVGPGPADVSDPSLVAWYPFNGNAYDESGNGNDGSSTGAMLTSDRFDNPGRAYFFSGNGAFILLQGFTALNWETGDFSVSLWYRTTEASDRNILSFVDSLESGWYIITEHWGDRPDVVFQNNGVEISRLNANGKWNDSLWHHLVFTRAGNGTIRIYMDGSLHDTQNLGGFGPFNTQMIIVGANWKAESPSFNGQIDDIIIYNQSITAMQVDSLFHLGNWTPAGPLAENVIYVHASATGNNDGTSWLNAFINLQSALATAGRSKEIWIAQGTYKPTSADDRKASFDLPSNVGFYGGFSGTETLRESRDPATYPVILDGDIGAAGTATDNSFNIIMEGDSIIVDGFTITNGYAAGGTDHSDNYGAGMHVYGKDSVTIRNCRFINNSSNMSGAGLFTELSNVYVSGCEFTGNNAMAFHGGAMIMINSQFIIEDCIFSANTASTNHMGGAIHMEETSDGIIRRTIFIKNYAGWGGALSLFGNSYNPDIINCLFYQNNSRAGGAAIYNHNSTVSIMNATFHDNCNTTSNSVLMNYLTSTISITNCILWNNATEISNSGGTVNTSYSNSRTFYSGTGNISIQPEFTIPMDPDGADNVFFTPDDGLNLQTGSQSADIGNGTGAPADDVMGRPRPAGAGFDLGAYESQ